MWEAFVELTTCRHYHMGGEGPIPWTAMQAWADWWGMKDMDDRAFFCRVLRRLDAAYLELQGKRSEAASKSRKRG